MASASHSQARLFPQGPEWWGNIHDPPLQHQACGPHMTDPDKVFSCSIDVDITMALGGSIRHLDLYGFGCSVALGTNTVVPDSIKP